MGVNDGGAGPRAGDAFGNDGLDRIGNAGLQSAAPGPFNAASIQTLRIVALPIPTLVSVRQAVGFIVSWRDHRPDRASI
jgi:hypothetical protein